jgi:hypothetical protein
MARKDRRPQAAQRLRALLEAGDHRRAREEARALAADAGADAAEREEAAAILSSLAPDRGVLAAGAVGVAIALVVTALALVIG